MSAGRSRVEMRQIKDALLRGAALAQIAHGKDLADGALRLGIAHQHFHRHHPVVGGTVRRSAPASGRRDIEDFPDRVLRSRAARTGPTTRGRSSFEIEDRVPSVRIRPSTEASAMLRSCVCASFRAPRAISVVAKPVPISKRTIAATK